MLGSRFIPVVLLAALSAGVAGLSTAEMARPAYDPGGVVLNVTAEDLGRIARGALRTDPNGRVEGGRDSPKRGLTGLTYSAEFSTPQFDLHEDGSASVQMEILEARLEVERIERRVMASNAFCENAAVAVDPELPVDVKVSLEFLVEDGDLRIVPRSLEMPNARKGFRLIKPSRCGHGFMPKWLLWWLGKPQLRKSIRNLDGVLLDRLQDSAAELNDDEGFLNRQWRDVRLYPRSVDTRRGSLFVSLATTVAETSPTDESLVWTGSLTERSFLGFSESFANAIVQSGFSDRPRGDSRGSKSLRKIFRSEAIDALIPGLQDIEDRDGLYVTFAFADAPRLEFVRLAELGDETSTFEDDDPRAAIRIVVSGIVIQLMRETGDGPEQLGTLRVESASIGTLPYQSLAGGISFEVVQNDWVLSSSGLEFDEEVLTATLQELVFSHAFETHYDPLATQGIQVGTAEFQPRYFELVGDYLVIGLTGLGSEPDDI